MLKNSVALGVPETEVNELIHKIVFDTIEKLASGASAENP